MGIQNFWDNFKFGFGMGMLNSNPFFGCSMYNFPMFSSFNSFSIFNPFNSMPFIPSFTPMSFTPTFPMFNQSSFYTPPNFSIANTYTPPSENLSLNNSLFETNTQQNLLHDNYSLNIDTLVKSTPPSEKSKKTVKTEKSSEAKNIAKTPKVTNHSGKDKYFNKMLAHILSCEAGYVNDPLDRGGETNKGIIKTTYDDWRRRHGLPTRSVKEITDEEVRAIYYEFYTQCGADKIDNPRVAMMVFDIAVGSGCTKAKELYKKSGGDLKKLEQLRRDWYNDIVKRRSDQKRFIKGWQNRVTKTMAFVNTSLPEKISS